MSLARLVGRVRDSWPECLDVDDPGWGAPGGQWRR